jgi:hypothetical protein
MTFNAPMCHSVSDFRCGLNAFSVFYDRSGEWYKINLLNCSYSNKKIIMHKFCIHNSPLECKFTTLTYTTSSILYPVPESLPFFLYNSDALCMQYFGMNGTATYAAIMSKALNLSTVAQTLDKRLASLMIFYDELAYTDNDQDPKMEVIIKAFRCILLSHNFRFTKHVTHIQYIQLVDL